MSRPGEDRAHPLEGAETYVDAIDKLFSYPRVGLTPEAAEAIAALEDMYEATAHDLLRLLKPCADRSFAIRQLRVSYLTACDSIRLGGAF